jgi:pimeloyl-ACP methyl ester carboxylesterase
MMGEPVEHRFAAPAGEICWFEWGKAGQGPSLLLLHATGFHARCWDRVVAVLPVPLHIVAPDLRGHGRSYRPQSLGDWAATADDIVALCDALFEAPVVAAGHSMGGCVLARAAAQRPALFSRLVLVDPVIMTPDIYHNPIYSPDARPEDHPVARRRNVWDSAEQMIAHFAERPPYSHWRRDVLEDYCRYGLVPSSAHDGLELACPPDLEASAYLGSWKVDPYPMLGRVECPVTVLRARNGERSSALDFSISPTAPDLAMHFRQGVDLHWQDQSHFIPMEVPGRLAALIATQLVPNLVTG